MREDGTRCVYWGLGFPIYAQRRGGGLERNRAGMCGDRPKPRGSWRILRAGFVQGFEGARKRCSARMVVSSEWGLGELLFGVEGRASVSRVP